jgi:hypothetical protein
MDVLPNIDVSDVMEIPKVFQCDEQTLPCDHTTKFRWFLHFKMTRWSWSCDILPLKEKSYFHQNILHNLVQFDFLSVLFVRFRWKD